MRSWTNGASRSSRRPVSSTPTATATAYRSSWLPVGDVPCTLITGSSSSLRCQPPLTPVDPLLADPVAEGLLDDAELSGHVSNGALLVDDQRCRVSAELLR